MGGKAAAVIVGLGVLGCLPVWSCGLRRRLTLWEFVLDHTIFGPSPEYVPEELYTQPLSEQELQQLCALHEAQRVLRAATSEEERPEP